MNTYEDDEFDRIANEAKRREGQPYHFDIYVSPSQRNAVLEEVAKHFDKMPFGDTSASFSQYVRNLKT